MVFGLFETPSFSDAALGVFQRSRGKWRGAVELGDGKRVPLVLDGSRRSPDADALRIARSLHVDYPAWRPAMERALFEHFEPYGEAIAAGELANPPQALPRIASSSDVWKYVTLQYIALTEPGGSPVVEFGIAAAWDEEHTLGARFRAGDLIELNGSVLPP